VAKAGSDGATANDGGRCDWTTQGALICQALDHAVFSLPVGQLSPIIEGPVGFHVVRVTERQKTAVTPFLEAQVEIKEKIKQQRSEKQFREYMAKVQARTPVWTIFDEDPANPQTANHPQQSPVR
jgi:parvulin-like peptidyl-prolyl isomerase